MMCTRNRCAAAGLALLLFVFSHTSYAVAIEFTESAKTVTVGVPFTLQLRIFDVNASLDPPLRSFDVEVGFSRSHLQFEGATFGDPVDQLNLTGLAEQSVTPPFTSGLDRSSVRIAETSNDFDVPLQPGDFVLATLTFRALESGTTTIGVLDTVLHGFGNRDYADIIPGAATISAVPEASSLTWLVCALALFSLGARVRGRRRNATRRPS